MTRRSYLIIGCGRFGRRAAKEILRRSPLSKISIVDHNSDALRNVCGLPVHTSSEDGLTYLHHFLAESISVDYIIPAVPFHLAFESVLARLKPSGARRTAPPPLPGLPNQMRGKSGDLYTSFADFLCPEDCPEPSQYCTVTRKRRSEPLYRKLAALSGSFQSKVIRSEQLCPGVGGFRPEALQNLFHEVEEKVRSRQSGLLLISTACRCHGVISALSLYPPRFDRGKIGLFCYNSDRDGPQQKSCPRRAQHRLDRVRNQPQE
jgi:hypothetical protein